MFLSSCVHYQLLWSLIPILVFILFPLYPCFSECLGSFHLTSLVPWLCCGKHLSPSGSLWLLLNDHSDSRFVPLSSVIYGLLKKLSSKFGYTTSLLEGIQWPWLPWINVQNITCPSLCAFCFISSPYLTLVFSSVQSLSRVQLFAAGQASLSITNSRGVQSNSCPSSRWCRPAISSSVVPFSSCPQQSESIPPSIRIFSNEKTLRMRWPKYWSFSFSIIPSKEHPGLISFRMDWWDLLAVQGTLKSLLQHHSSKASILQHSAFFIVQLSHPYMATGKTIALTRWTFVVSAF